MYIQLGEMCCLLLYCVLRGVRGLKRTEISQSFHLNSNKRRRKTRKEERIQKAPRRRRAPRLLVLSPNEPLLLTPSSHLLALRPQTPCFSGLKVVLSFSLCEYLINSVFEQQIELFGFLPLPARGGGALQQTLVGEEGHRCSISSIFVSFLIFCFFKTH